MLISIVGPTGSGKSTITELLKSYSDKVVSLNIDKIGHQVNNLPPVKKKLIEEFGPKILQANEINRKELSKIVFSSNDAMDKLTEITWPYMEKEIDSFISLNKDKIIILDWALIPKTKFFTVSDLKILIYASYEIRLKRAIQRDGITEETFKKRDLSGISYQDLEFDYIINNNDEDLLEKEVKLIYDKSIIHR